MFICFYVCATMYIDSSLLKRELPACFSPFKNFILVLLRLAKST